MPESRRRKKPAKRQPPSQPTPSAAEAPSGRWVPITGSALLLLGLAWIVVYYVAGNDIPVMRELDSWNLLIGMGIVVAGFMVFTRWR